MPIILIEESKSIFIPTWIDVEFVIMLTIKAEN